MRDLGKIILHIPAREGSKRVPRKNLREMNGKPMISYVIEASIKAGITNQMYVNTDSKEIIEYVNEAYPEFKIYRRDKTLADDNASSDQFNHDIINNLQPDTLVMINPVCPLLAPEDILNAVEHFRAVDCDTLITADATKMQTFCEGLSVNINVDEPLAPSQNNKKVYTLNWAVTIWDATSFNERMENFGYAVLGNKRELFEIDAIKGIKVSEEKDFLFAETILKFLSL